MERGVSITVKNQTAGNHFSAYHVLPAQSRPKGGIVLLQEIFGLNEYIREVCEDFAKDGWEVIAPALFDREAKNIELGYDKEGIAQGRALKEAVDPFSESDILACCGQFNSGLKLAVIGYCWGGSLAWRMACRHKGFDAAIAYYGGEVPVLSDEKPLCPVQAHFGRQDASIPMSGVEGFLKSRPEVETYLYEADHGFSCHHRKQYDAPSAQLARERVNHFLDQHIAVQP